MFKRNPKVSLLIYSIYSAFKIIKHKIEMEENNLCQDSYIQFFNCDLELYERNPPICPWRLILLI